MAAEPHHPENADGSRTELSRRSEILQVFLDAGVTVEPELEALLKRYAEFPRDRAK